VSAFLNDDIIIQKKPAQLLVTGKLRLFILGTYLIMKEFPLQNLPREFYSSKGGS